MSQDEFTTVAVPKASLEVLLAHAKVPKDQRHHVARCSNRQTLKQEGYTPTSFGPTSFGLTEKIHAWIAEKEAEGCEVDFAVGEVACTQGRLSVYWHATKPSPFGRSSKGCIDLSGETFSFA